MAPNGRANPNCANATNPYHECTEACSQKTKQTKPHKINKNSGYRGGVTNGELGRKTNEDRRTYPGCPKASNPYHECDENCYKKLSGADSGAIPLTYGRRKKLGSKPEPPVIDSVPASKIGAIYLSDASSPISHYSEKNEVEPKSDERILSGLVSGEIRVIDDKPVNRKNQLKDGAEHLGNPIQTNKEDKIASGKVVPITNVDESGEGITTSAGGSTDFSFSGIPPGSEEDSDEETKSVVSESRVPVGRYHVKESFAPILRAIFDKYGDIGASCHLESVVIRSYYVECVCFVVQELQSASIIHLTKSKVKELLAILKDVESAQLRVAWLRSILEEIAENIELINQHLALETAKATSDSEVESLKKELESEQETLAQKEQEVTDIKTRIGEIRDHLSELELKSSELDQGMSSVKSKIDNLPGVSLIDELL